MWSAVNYCEECESTTTCAACKQGTFKSQNGKCRYTCNAGYYKDNDGNCAECHADCGGIAGACSGPYPDDCTMCEFNKTSNQFKKYLVENIRKCVLPENCPPASFPSPNGKCTPCVSGWTRCDSLNNWLDDNGIDAICGVGNCMHCQIELWIKCFQGFELDTTTNKTCIKKCDPGYYSVDNVNCNICPGDWATCDNTGVCTSCEEKRLEGELLVGTITPQGLCEYYSMSSKL